MLLKKIKVSAVSYLNTLPFLYGINHSKINEQLELSLDIPSDCAKKLLSGEVDLGLVPVAIIPQLKKYHIVSDYCIGAKGEVDSVALYSEVPLNEIEAIYLDYQSRTSVNLAKVLANQYWKIAPKWLETKAGFENKIEGKTAGVIIGDRTFNLVKKYKYKYDLAEEWMGYTGLPFVFACWVSNIKLPKSFTNQFNQALKHGINNIDKVVDNYNEKTISKKQLNKYLSTHISYNLDADKTKALHLFLKAVKEM